MNRTAQAGPSSYAKRFVNAPITVSSMSLKPALRPARMFVLLLGLLSASASVTEAQPQTGRIAKEAPMFLLPDAKRQPLLILEEGVFVEVHRREGDWMNVTVDGSQQGRRTGYVQAYLIQLVTTPTETIPRVTAASSIPPKSAAPASTSAASMARSAALPPSRAVEAFQKSKLSVTVEDKTRELDAIVRYEPTALVIVDKNSGASAKTFPYAEMKGAEYSYAKNPRWKTAIFVSPLFLFTSGKKHWFLVQGDGDYALLHLDKSNYRLILAAFEARTGIRVETVSDTK